MTAKLATVDDRIWASVEESGAHCNIPYARPALPSLLSWISWLSASEVQ